MLGETQISLCLCCQLSRDGAVVARRAHNPKVTGSSPVPATDKSFKHSLEAFFCSKKNSLNADGACKPGFLF